jgi:hypothetical protein
MRRYLTYLAAAAVPVAICAGIALARMPKSALDGPPSDIIFPVQDIPLRFTHAAHLRRGAECVDCHADARTSKSSADRLIPGEDACKACHAIERDKPDKQVAAGKPPARCDACHVGFDPKAPMDSIRRIHIPTPNLKFPHDVHAKTDCIVCHGDLEAENMDLCTREDLPRMRLCLGCHDGKQAASACTTCHMAAPGGMVQTDYPEGKLLPSGVLRGDAHDSMFRSNHGQVARNDQRYCETCHKKSYCTDCHDGVIKPMDFHANDYVNLHAVDARRNTPDCSSCHRQQTFCIGCHSRSGVLGDTMPGRDSDAFPLQPRASSFAQGLGNPDRTGLQRYHPAGWVRYSSAGSLLDDENARRAISHHAYQAQRNIRQCASCHRESFCTQCHTAKIDAQDVSPAPSPHPNNWRGSRQCRALEARAGRMCLRCHVNVVYFAGCDHITPVPMSLTNR